MNVLCTAAAIIAGMPRCLVAQVRYWMSSGVVLDAYGDVPAFRAVKEEAEQVMGRLRKKLADRLESADTCREDLHEAASLLLQLKEPRDALLRRYLSVREKRLHASVKATVDAWAAPKTGAAAGSVRSDDEAGLLSMRVLEEAKDCLLSFNDLLPTALGDKAAVGARPEDEAGEETGEGAGGGAKEEAEKGRSGGVMGDVVEAVGRCLDAYWRGPAGRGAAALACPWHAAARAGWCAGGGCISGRGTCGRGTCVCPSHKRGTCVLATALFGAAVAEGGLSLMVALVCRWRWSFCCSAAFAVQPLLLFCGFCCSAAFAVLRFALLTRHAPPRPAGRQSLGRLTARLAAVACGRLLRPSPAAVSCGRLPRPSQLAATWCREGVGLLQCGCPAARGPGLCLCLCLSAAV